MNMDGDSFPRQRASSKNIKGVALATKVLAHYKVSGTTPLQDRPGVRDLLEYSKKTGSMAWVFEDEKRLARTLKADLESRAWAKENGISLIHSTIPGLWTSDDPTMEFLAHTLGSISEMDNKTRVANLKRGRERVRQTSKRRTLTRARKVVVPPVVC